MSIELTLPNAGAVMAAEETHRVSVVIPVYRSAESLELLIARLRATLLEMGRPFEIILVDDCSPDNSWEVLQSLKAQSPYGLKIVRLLKNSGQHNAILCGFSLVTGDVVITMDDDLQNPPEEIPRLVEAVDRGYDLVIAAYDAKKHSGFRNAGGNLIDNIQRTIFKLPKEFQLTSFRAASRVVVTRAREMGGVYPYITSMLFANAAKYTNVPVRHDARPFGRSNYSLKRSLLLAANLIFSYSSLPLYLIGGLCFASFVFATVFGLFVLVRTLQHGSTVPGWASLAVILSYFNALLQLCLVIMCLYLSRVYQQITRSQVSYAIAEIK